MRSVLDRRSPVTGLLVLMVLLLLPSSSEAGPPWITVEYPPNPLDRETRDALLVVRTYKHGAVLESGLTARAEGLVSGERRSVPLTVTPTSRPGVHAVRGELPPEGTWVVVVDMQRGGEGSALVAMEPDGTLTAVRIPHHVQDGWTVPHEATAGEVNEMLRTARALAQAHRELRVGSAAPWSAALLAGLGLVVLPLGLRRARRRD